MARKKDDLGALLLTDAELEIMTLLWNGHPATVRDLVEALPPERKLAYTTVATFLKILEQKGFVRGDKDERAIAYAPLVARQDYEERTLRRLSRDLFRGEIGRMAVRLFELDALSDAELDALRRIVDARSKRP
jgi:predicted transcriptional regulator